jgi:hypothetical protein
MSQLCGDGSGGSGRGGDGRGGGGRGGRGWKARRVFSSTPTRDGIKYP